MTQPAHILVVDDEPDIRSLISDILEDENYQVRTADGGEQARQARLEHRPDLILLDIWMPDIDGISLLKEWSEDDSPDCPIIMISGHGNVETAVEATRLGAYDFLEKPLSLAKLLLTVQRALETARLEAENIGLRNQTQGISDPIGSGARLGQLRDQTKLIAEHDASVLISGEPGSGRETFARFLHTNSARHQGPFIDVRVGSITLENASVEIFGSEQGDHVHYGRLEQADGGTLFLDEIADMDIDTQGKLLGALDSGSFLRVGGTQPVKTNVRVIAATRYDLAEAVRDGRFRDDLFYRLNVVPLSVPALREHAEDIPELLEYYVDRFVTQDRLRARSFDTDALRYLCEHNWPGNVPELKNLVQRLLIMGKDETIGLAEIRIVVSTGVASSTDGDGFPCNFELPLREAREQFERYYLQQGLENAGGNVGQLAKIAGMERTHVYRKLKSLGIEIKDKR
ncbi:MAG TPA: sigma-54-dependent Fis family transcriptional regulator [Chromatiaceae bacterium]|jgi:DNA-binding NtrC family response regulator|nr:sigma-54-dependent Fis family transcriptional regulator [Chromatiaceae bacterium]HIA09337.1 sigma-54-dependent Fis family transcriptional regulator [Chromatiaceae bacterium]HIN81886.1 sigma-54-dependent Fis family transcriptional regulator [Chromatiales bacterium]HIO54094.1 sigma-54-dependent Fis family transcriptional regulator [Chromatiales bacterium]